MQKVFLLGASGQLGREWQAFFSSTKADDVIIPYTSAQLDITNLETLRHELKKQQPDIIINCAAYTKVDKAESEHKIAKKINSAAVKSLAHLCKKFDIKLIHFSTDYVFSGEKENQDRFPQGYPEDHKAKPVNWYGQTKWEGEHAIRDSGCKYMIMRISWLCGAYGSNFVKTMLHLAESHSEVKVVDDQTGSPTFADKLVADTFKLIEQKQEGTYHHTSNGIISWADFAEEVFEISGKDINVSRIPSSEFPTKAKRPFYSKLDTAKIEHINDIKMEDWKKGLQRLLNKLDETV